MPHNYYGTLESDKGKTTRAGHQYIDATAQTFDGSVTVSIGKGTKKNRVQIFVRRGSGVGGFCLGEWALADFILARKLIITEVSKENDGETK